MHIYKIPDSCIAHVMFYWGGIDRFCSVFLSNDSVLMAYSEVNLWIMNSLQCPSLDTSIALFISLVTSHDSNRSSGVVEQQNSSHHVVFFTRVLTLSSLNVYVTWGKCAVSLLRHLHYEMTSDLIS